MKNHSHIHHHLDNDYTQEKQDMYVWLILLSVCIFFPTSASAHIPSPEAGLKEGFKHPIFGLDHLLAMVTVGIVSSQIGGKAIWTVPATFVCVMIIGGILGMVGVPLLFTEYAIALSVILLGLAVAIDKKLPVLVVIVCVGIFAIFHGHGHGVQMPNLKDPMSYAVGFVITTIGLHLAGVAIGSLAARSRPYQRTLQIVGIVIAILGVRMLVVIRHHLTTF